MKINKSDVYFFDDGGGVRVPVAWKIQYWDGAAFTDVPGDYPVAADTYNSVSFDSVGTTKLRVVLESGQASVGLLEWKTYAVPPDGVRAVHVPTPVNTLPDLPGTVETTYADGGRGTAEVTWQPVTLDQVKTGGSSFRVTGLAVWACASRCGPRSTCVRPTRSPSPRSPRRA